MQLKDAIERYFSKHGFFHFTDERNLPGITAAKGILSRREAKRLKHTIEAPGGNDWSIEADNRIGMDAYVHLCFTSEHSMEYRAKRDGRIQTSRFLKIHSNVLNIDGTMCTLGVSNKKGITPLSLEKACEDIDFEVLYERTEWKDKKVNERLQAVRKYEILVPTKVPLELISGL